MIRLCRTSLCIGRRGLLEDVSFAVEAGAPTVLLGANGSGKSLVLRILATELRPTAGTALVAGLDVVQERARVRQVVGWLGDPPPFGSGSTVSTTLEVAAAGHGMRGAQRRAAIDDALALTDLVHHRDADLRSLSRGEAHRVELARTLLHDPDVLLLDEPLAGLDPLGEAEILEVLRELSQMEKTILIATNMPDSYGDLFEIGVVLQGGRAIAVGDAKALCAPFADLSTPTWRAAVLRRLLEVRDNDRDQQAAETYEVH